LRGMWKYKFAHTSNLMERFSPSLSRAISPSRAPCAKTPPPATPATSNRLFLVRGGLVRDLL
jgi:hypothetical protein